MTNSLQISVILFGFLCPFILSVGAVCQLTQGLPCNTTETLVPGSSFTVASKTCQNGKYPKKERCAWYFSVEGCKPSLHCDALDVKGKGRRCKGDRLRVETENRRKAFCRMNQIRKNFTDDETSFFDLKFKTNNKIEGPGFQCTISCSGDAPTTPAPVADCQCGLANRKQKIVGGSETKLHEYPWQVGLVSPGIAIPWCGGAILSSDTILTAAHCTLGQEVDSFKIVVDEHDVDVDDGQEMFDVCSKTEHPNYDSNTNEHDFSILTLCKPITFSKDGSPSPVCLPNQPGSSYDSVLSTVSGWGTLFAGGPQSSKLMGVDVTTIANTECATDYGAGIIKDSMICAKGSGKDACQGDSGGPLITKEQGDFYSLIGIVSFGVGCANPDYPGVYSRVTDDLSWIKENVKGTMCSSPKKHFTRKLNTFDSIDED